jgi:hypothetical protein
VGEHNSAMYAAAAAAAGCRNLRNSKIISRVRKSVILTSDPPSARPAPRKIAGVKAASFFLPKRRFQRTNLSSTLPLALPRRSFFSALGAFENSPI